jgi:hypothetical protein
MCSYTSSLHLGGRPHRGARVVRAVDDDEPGARRDGRCDAREVGPEAARRERHAHHGATGELDVGRVAVVAGLEHDHLVARVHTGQHGGQDGLRGAGGDGDLAAGVVAAAVQLLDLGRHPFAQGRHAGHRRVLVVALGHGGVHVFQQLGVAREIGEPLAEVDGAHLLRQRRHHGEDGGAHLRQAASDGGCRKGWGHADAHRL